MDPPDQAVAQRTDERNQTLTTKKFNLPEWLMKEIEEYANQHYQGNASEFIRQAILDHIATLEGNNEYDVKKLEMLISSLEEQVNELTEEVESKLDAFLIQHRQPQQNQQQPETESEDSDKGALQTEVYKTISNAESPLRLTEVQEQTDAEILKIEQLLTEFVKRGLLNEVNSADQPTYEINTSK